MSEREHFGPGLRRERERCGISLQDIATRTKISASFFEALERNDLSRWPGGIFRRSFLRSYAECIGLQPDHLVREVARLFPGEEEGSGRRAVPPKPAMRGLGLSLLAPGAAAVAIAGVVFGWPYSLASVASAGIGVLLTVRLIVTRRAAAQGLMEASVPHPHAVGVDKPAVEAPARQAGTARQAEPARQVEVVRHVAADHPVGKRRPVERQQSSRPGQRRRTGRRRPRA